MRSRPRAGAVGASLAAVAATVGILGGIGWNGGTVVSWLIVVAPLVGAAVMAWRWGRGLRARPDGPEGSAGPTVEREP